ncbi:MAG: DUF3352 domain-containing protein [Candidatus Limnocylindrales bacterium]
MTPVARVQEISAPLTPVHRAPGGRVRWLVAIAATLIVVIIAGAIIVVAGSTAAKEVAPAYLPADTVLYADARLDLPGDQRDQMAAFLAKFPGFADQASLEAKLDQALDRLVKSATGDEYTYTGNVKPWFGGQAAVGAWSGGANATTTPALIVLSVSDRSKLPTQLDQASQDLAKELGVKVSVEDHGGISVITLSGSSTSGSAANGLGLTDLSFAITDDAIIAARDAQTVGAALHPTAGKAPSGAGAAGFQQALGSLSRDRLGTLYLDGAALAQLIPALPSPAAGVGSALAGFSQTVAAELRLENGDVVARARLTPAAAPSGSPEAEPTTSVTAQHVPANAAVYAEVHDVGAGWKTLVTRLQQQPGYAQLAPQLGTLEGILGSKLDAYLDWAKDLGVAVTVQAAGPQGGVVVSTTNAAAGEARLKQLVTLLRLAGTSGVTVTEQTYKGTTITTITLDPSLLSQLGGATLPSPGTILPLPSNLPITPDASAKPTGGSTLPAISLNKVQLSYAFGPDVFVLGVGDGFVKQVLDVTPATSLASQARFSDAVKAAGGPASNGLAYADITALRSYLEGQLSGAEKAKYEADVKPYLIPFDRLVALASRDGSTRLGTLIILTTD